MILFLSDVHLSLSKPHITAHFLHFTQHHALKANAIYILGDLFDVWVGDDDQTTFNSVIKYALKNLTDSGIHVYFQPGNRDFLMGARFAQETGVTLLDDYAVIDLFGTPTLLTHGDLLCSDDVAYQAFRIKSHAKEWQQMVLSKPLWLRLMTARWYRFRSFWHKRKKTYDVMDVNQITVENIMRQHQCWRLIHGHTHRHATHYFTLDGKIAERFVLSPWDDKGGYILTWSDPR
jgi:UDP-2,3-diacylglucosamine hydrolase